MMFRVRVDEIVPDMKERLSTFFSDKEHVLVHHVLPNGKNPHFHVFLNTELFLSIQAFRYQFQKLTNAKGPEMSIKQCDIERKDEYIQYLFNRKHGNTPTLISTTIDTANHEANALKVAEDFSSSVKKTKKKNDEITNWEISEKVRELIFAREDPLSEYEIYSQAIDAAIDVCRKHKKTYTDFSIVRLVQTAITSDKNYRENFKKSVMERMFK